MKPSIIGIAGGTASGKTTIANYLYESASKIGCVVLIKIDDYYLGKTKVPKNEDGKLNFDHPNAYDIELLSKHLNDLKQGLSIEKPTYDFVTSTRTNITEHVEPADVIIVEGIMVFAIQPIRDECDIKIFVETPDDIRFIRRLKRDILDRGRSLESVVNQYLSSVRPMHESFVEPSKKYADIIIPDGGYNEVALDFLNTKVTQLLTKKK